MKFADPQDGASARYSNKRKDSIAAEKTLADPVTDSCSTPWRMSRNYITEESNKDAEQITFAVATRRDSEGQVRYSFETVHVTSNKVIRSCEVSPFFWIPLITVLREGLEGMVFLGGIGIYESPENLAVVAVLLCHISCCWRIPYIHRQGLQT
ncbi:UNVERIFIED_CONTAM: hypothetical protein HDU68_006689 [Siphonaria sp. JEL0065]|nr:hypothetical protein HDU68_006689 [Siphonaria sp. JEL0065]